MDWVVAGSDSRYAYVCVSLGPRGRIEKVIVAVVLQRQLELVVVFSDSWQRLQTVCTWVFLFPVINRTFHALCSRDGDDGDDDDDEVWKQ